MLNVDDHAAADTPTMATATPALPGQRLLALDALRGATIAGMILVNTPGSWEHVYPPLRHAEWHGCTPTDLVFPFFLFIAGVALPLSFGKRLERGASRGRLFLHSLRRAAILFGLGLLLNAAPLFEGWQTLRIMGVLQRIALVYLVAAGLYLALRPAARWLAAGAILVSYHGLMLHWPVPGFGPGDLSPEGNLAAFIDRALIGSQHLWGGRPWDPEGLLSSLPAVATALLGIFVGERLRAATQRGRLTRASLTPLLVGSIAAVLAGLAWGRFFPINKNLWTSSYVLYTAGLAGLALAACIWLIDVRGKRAWARPFILFGVNPIALYVGSSLMSGLLADAWTIRAPDGGTTSAYDGLYRWLFASWAGPLPGSLAFALATVALWLGVAWWLARRRIVITI